MMKKILVFLLLLVTFFATPPVTGAEVQVETSGVNITIDTKLDGKIVPGTDQMRLTIYDISSWTREQPGTAKAISKVLGQQYGKKTEAKKWAQDQKFPVIKEKLLVDANGMVETSLPILATKIMTGYLIISEGETQKFQMLPIFLISIGESLPESLTIYAKYDEITTTTDSEPDPDPDDPKKPDEPTTDSSRPNLPSTQGSTSTSSFPKKYLPVTGELLKSYLSVGGSLVLLSMLGFIVKKRKKQEDEKNEK